MREVLVIGAGASGLMAALAAAREGAKVTVLDKNKKAGRKLLLTGSGRCNLTNTDPGLFERFHSASPESLKHIAGGFRKLEDSNQTVRFFESLGLACTVRDGYVYPASMMASSVLHVLEDACRRSGVRFRFSEKILSVRTDEDRRWHASTASWTYSADSLILCCGSPAWPLSGADTAGYGLCKMTGHRVTPLLPSLTGLYCSGTGLKEAKGARTDAVVTLLSSADGKGERTVQQTETGQVQWTGDGISGIVVFQISSAAARLLQDGRRKLYVSTDLCPDYTAKELTALIENAAAISCGPDPVKILGGLNKIRTFH